MVSENGVIISEHVAVNFVAQLFTIVTLRPAYKHPSF